MNLGSSKSLIGCFLVYCETIKRHPKKRLIYECRCDERLKSKTEKSTRLVYTTLTNRDVEHEPQVVKISDRVFP
jgi:hypothetical protein